MKAIFAVSALAAAISAQAMAADTEATTTFSGAMDAQFVLDLANDPSTYDVDLNDNDDNDGYFVSMETEIKNGPFSASLGLTAEEDEDAAITVGDIVVTDGALSFGQVGNLMSTDEYTGDMAAAGTADVDVAFKYAVAEGATVQLQGEENDAGTAVGLAGQYTGEAGAVSYTAEAEMTASAIGADLDMDPPYFAGVGVTYTSDMVTVMAALNATGDSAGNSVLEYAVSASSTVAGATIDVAWTDVNTDVESDEVATVSVSYAVDAITVSAGYEFTTAESTGDEVTAGVAWAEDALSASADVTISNFDADEADDLLTELNVTYTSEAGVEYYADYTLQGEGTNELALGAKYSF